VIGVLLVSLFLQVPPIQITPPIQTQAQAPANVTVNYTPPPPDPQAVASMYEYAQAVDEFDKASVPVGWATALLQGDNIWTTTPWSHMNFDAARVLRGLLRGVALGLFLLGIIYTGGQLAIGPLTGSTTAQQLLPIMIAGFMVAMYSETVAHRAIDLCNWINMRIAGLGAPSLTDFSATPLTLPERPTLQTVGETAFRLAAGFTSGLLGSVVYAIILILLEVKLIMRDAVLLVTTTAMPIAGVLWAFKITRGWGMILFKLFFGWLFGQPLVVICLALSGGLLTLMNLNDTPVSWIVKVAVLFVALKVLTLFAGGLGGGSLFGLAALTMLLRRAMFASRNAHGTASPPAAPTHSATVQASHVGGTGDGSAATGRAWRPALGSA
jgi:hypothetical protein